MEIKMFNSRHNKKWSVSESSVAGDVKKTFLIFQNINGTQVQTISKKAELKDNEKNIHNNN